MQTKSERLESWKEKRLEFQKSSMTRRAYCEKNKIKKTTLDYWFSRIRKMERAQGLVEVKPISAGIVNAAVVVTVGRFRVELNDLAAVQMLASTVKALESVG